jgi:hypothetical protein
MANALDFGRRWRRLDIIFAVLPVLLAFTK